VAREPAGGSVKMESQGTSVVITPEATQSAVENTTQAPPSDHPHHRRHRGCCRRYFGKLAAPHKDKEKLELGCGQDEERPGNKVITAKYNVFTFLPVSFVVGLKLRNWREC
jgi:hypothetical protein